jgi:hypothetical protein
MPALQATAVGSLFAVLMITAPDPTVATFKGQQGVCTIVQIQDALKLLCFKVDARDWVRSPSPIGAFSRDSSRLCIVAQSGNICRPLTVTFPLLPKTGRFAETASSHR